MTIKTTTVTLPAFLASALVNGDETGLEPNDEKVLAQVLATLKADNLEVYDVVRDADGNADEARFTWSYRLYGGDANGGDVLDFVAHDHGKD